MINRPANLINLRVRITFDLVEYNYLEVDLEHINKGKRGIRKNTLTFFEVVGIAKALIEGENLQP